jgi:poly(A) polymerase
MRIDADWVLSGPAQQVCRILTDAGHQAWFVGGCVRNAIINAGPTDIDITTDARPDAVIALAEQAGLRAVPTGIDHGTVTIVVDGIPFEVTTFRRDIETDGRHAKVSFSDSIAEDATRRDFTMNALYADPDGQVADPVGGIPDLLAGHVRFIGDPHQRIHEDYLRILRFFRFQAWFGAPDGGIDADGLAACADHLDGLAQLSRERIGTEMRKLLSAPNPAPALAAMAACGVLVHLLPGSAAHLVAVLVHVEEAAGLRPDWIRRLAALGGEGVETTLRLANADKARLQSLTEGLASEDPPAVLGYHLGMGAAMDVLALRAALSTREIDPVHAQSAQRGAVQTFPVQARDLMPGLQGPALGARLADLESRWIASDFTLSREKLLSL